MLDIWTVIQNSVNLASHIPVERWLFRRDYQKDMEALRKSPGTEAIVSTPAPSISHPATSQKKSPGLPSTAETVMELKRRLAKELYQIQLDLASGARIAGKPCDCLSHKHTLGIEAAAEELIPMDPNLVYQDILDWLRAHDVDFSLEEVARRPPEYYRSLAHEPRELRKRLLDIEPLSIDEAKKLAAEEATKEVEQRWESQEKKPER